MTDRQDPPEPWEEILPGESLSAAFALLQATFPYRYLRYDVDVLAAKLSHSRDTSSGVSVRSLRTFTWNDEGTPRIAALFFLRLLYLPPAYCLSVGIDSTITSGRILHNELLKIVRHMRNEAPGAVDLVNQRAIVDQNPSQDEDDLNDTTRSAVVKAAFMYATKTANPRTLVRVGDILPIRSPWPSRLKRWQVP